MNAPADVPTDVLSAFLLDAYAEWEGSDTDMLEAMAAHLAPLVTINPDVLVAYSDARRRQAVADADF